MKLSKIKLNPDNPRTFDQTKMDKLKKSIEEFPKMMKLRPMVVDQKGIVLGGNMRLTALKQLGYKEVPDEWVRQADELTEEEKKRFIIADNVGFGEWDWKELEANWDNKLLSDWGLELLQLEEEAKRLKNTEKLSIIKFENIYYEPEEIPDIKLKDCVDLEIFEEKLRALKNYDLTNSQFETLKLFAYRFIKIDFESVASYYYFNANDEEKKAIERLRLVLSDTGLEGFIQDDLLKTLENLDYWGE